MREQMFVAAWNRVGRGVRALAHTRQDRLRFGRARASEPDVGPEAVWLCAVLACGMVVRDGSAVALSEIWFTEAGQIMLAGERGL